MPVVRTCCFKPFLVAAGSRAGRDIPARYRDAVPARFGPIIGHAVARAFRIDGHRLLQTSRGPERLALARQVAMYLARTTLQLTLHEAGRMFGRDRSTAAHGCARVEDLRDQPRFDRAIVLIETIVQVFRRLGEIAR
jgi:hypothetical protein